MKRYHNFTKDLGIAGVAQLFIKLKGLILIPILIKVIGAYEYGIWARLIVAISLVTLLVTLGLPSSIIRFLAGEKNKQNIQEGFYACLLIVLFTAILSSCAVFFLSDFLSSMFFKTRAVAYIIQIIAFILIIMSLEEIILSLFLALKYVKTYSILIILGTLAEVSLIFVLVARGFGLWGVVISMLIVKSSMLLLEFLLAIKRIGIKMPTFRDMGSYLSLGVPLIPSGFSRWIVKSSGLYIIGFLMTSADVAVYSIAYAIGSAVLIFLAPLQAVLRPALSEVWNKAKTDEVNTFFAYPLKYFLMISIPSIFGTYIMAKPIISILSKPEFIDTGWIVVPIIAFASLLNGVYVIAVWIFSLIKKTRYVIGMWICAALINLCGNLILIPKIGVLGAAISTLISYLFVSIISIYILQKKTRVRVSILFIAKSFFASIVMMLVLRRFAITTLFELLTSICCGAIIYIITLIALKGFQSKEREFFKRLFSASGR